MSFLVVWSELAFEQMGRILRARPEPRAEYARILRAISDTLRDDPLRTGEAREDSDRIWFVGNLVITYSVDEESNAVEIAAIRLVRPE